MKTVSLRIVITSAAPAAASAARVEPENTPTHPVPVLFLEGAVTFADQTEHEERAFYKDGRLLNVLSFSVAVDAPSLMSKRAVAEHVKGAFSFDFPPCMANSFWESIDVKVLP
jgi:hypothetical protein